MKRKMCKILAVGLCCFALIVGCIYAVTSNFGKSNKEIMVYAPDGAPALALAKLLDEDTDNDGVTYTVVSATGIETRVTYNDPKKNADVCVLPITDASLHLSEGKTYQLLGVVTHGNFFLISESGETKYDKDNLASLIGKRIGFVQLGKLPGLVFRSILENKNIPYKVQSDLSSCENDVVNLINVKPTDVKKGLGFDLFSLPEPLVSAKINDAGFFTAGNVQELYDAENGYPQAVVVAKKTLVEHNTSWVDEFLNGLKENETWLQTAGTERILSAINTHLESGLTPSFNQNNLTPSVIAACGVRYTSGISAKGEINSLIKKLKKLEGTTIKDFSDKFFTEKY